MDWYLILFIIIVAVYLAMAIKIANENERFAVYALGRFVRLKGPGIILKMPGNVAELVRISLGAEGEVQSNEFVTINDRPLPYTTDRKIRAGSKVRVTGFSSSTIEVEPTEQFVVCEKCGHRNAV